MKRIAARGIILNGDELILIHRIRMENNKKVEYYVFPGAESKKVKILLLV